MSLCHLRVGQLFQISSVITLIAFTGCVSSTVLQSQPPGARVFLNNVPVGTTPYTMTDMNIVGTGTAVRLEYPGYQPLNTYIVRNEDLEPVALIFGIFLIVPLLWVLKYNGTHFYQLQPMGPGMGAPEGGWGQPGAYPPGPGGYPPAPNGYSPPPNGYAPPPNGYAPAPNGYPPAPNGYPEQQQQPPAGYPPGPGGYPPRPAGYPPAAPQPQQPQQP